MHTYKHERVLCANEELRDLVRQAERLVQLRISSTEIGIDSIQARLLNDCPEVGDAARVETLDGDLQMEFSEYVRNLRALQSALEKTHSL